MYVCMYACVYTSVIIKAIGTPKVIPTADFRISPGGRKHRKTKDNEE